MVRFHKEKVFTKKMKTLGRVCRSSVLFTHPLLQRTIMACYLAISETAKPPPRASRMVSLSPALTVLRIMVYALGLFS